MDKVDLAALAAALGPDKRTTVAANVLFEPQPRA